MSSRFFFQVASSLASLLAAFQDPHEPVVDPPSPVPQVEPLPEPVQAFEKMKFPTKRVLVPPEEVVPEPQYQDVVIEEIEVGQYYVIEANQRRAVWADPEGIVTVHEFGSDQPKLLIGSFPDKEGIWVREYKTPYLYLVIGLKPGECIITGVPFGFQSLDQIERQPLTVTGTGPKPPPDEPDVPDEPDEPDPPKPPEPVKSFRVIFVKESGATLNAQQSAIPGAKLIRDYLTKKTTPEAHRLGWKEFDPQSTATAVGPEMAKLWDAVRPQITYVPCLVVQVNGHATVMPFPANAAECLATLKKYGGE